MGGARGGRRNVSSDWYTVFIEEQTPRRDIPYENLPARDPKTGKHSAAIKRNHFPSRLVRASGFFVFFFFRFLFFLHRHTLSKFRIRRGAENRV